MPAPAFPTRESAYHETITKKMLTEEDYDLVMVDIKTPVMNGQQLYRYILESRPELANRVVFTTGDVINSET